MKNTREIYRVHPSVSYMHSIIANLKDRTGRSLDEWSTLLREEGPADLKEKQIWLKAEHGLGMTTIYIIVNAATGSNSEDYDEDSYLETAVQYVENLYSGKKAHLRPIHDTLMERGYKLGPDVAASPCTTMVPLYRHHVIAQIKPSTLSRVDLGLALKGSPVPYADRLIDTGGLEKGDRITHRIPVSDVAEIDGEVEYWLGIAYDLDE